MAYAKMTDKKTKTLERDIEDTTFGGGIGEGMHNVVISRIHPSEKHVDVTFTNGDDESIKQRFFFENFDGTDTSYMIKQLIASVAGEATEMWHLHSKPTELTNYLGTTVKIKVAGNGGVKFIRTPEGFTAAGHTTETLTELRNTLHSHGIKMFRKEIKEVHSDDTGETGTHTATTGGDTNTSHTSTSRSTSSIFEF